MAAFPVIPSDPKLLSKSRALLRTQAHEELHAILNWWIKNLVDPQQDGFYGRIDGRGQLHPKAEKGVILNTRLLWTFSAAGRQTGSPRYREMANRAFNYLLQNFWDEGEGGVYWMLDYQGNPTQTKKQIYAQAFAIYALSEYYLLTQSQESIDKAGELFLLIEKYSRDQAKGGYFEAFDRSWHPLEDLRLSEKDKNAAKTMNTHLHILEAYTNLQKTGAITGVVPCLRSLISYFMERFIDPASGHLHLFFDENWELKSEAISYGHDIECSWLMTEAAEAIADPDLMSRVETHTMTMAYATLNRGMDTDGAIINEAGPTGWEDTDKHWWPQAEAIVGFLNGFQISGDITFWKATLKCWSFIQTNIKDYEQGEWHWLVDQAGHPNYTEDKAGPWKAPYHNGRACLEMLHRIPRLKNL